MTTFRTAGISDPTAVGALRLPDIEEFDQDMTTYYKLHLPGHSVPLGEHLGNRDTTIITCEIAASLRPTERYADVRFPDMLIALGVNPEAARVSNGYIVSEQGKPPDFVLEVASPRNAREDETTKRRYYHEMGVAEYWLFDHTGGELYASGLAGDRLTEQGYQPIPIYATSDGGLRGHSQMLKLDLCWENGELRFRDPATHQYLTTHLEERMLRAQAEAERDAAQAQVRELEARLQQQQDQG